LAFGCGSPSSDDAAEVDRATSKDSSDVGPTAARTGTESNNPEYEAPDATDPAAPDEGGAAPHTVAPPPVTTPTNVPPPAQVAAAVAAVEQLGFTPIDTTDIEGPPAGGLHVIIAESTAPPHDRQWAFFFMDGRFVGNDLPEPSASIQFAWRSADTIALAYAVYRPDDRPCCPTGGAMNVRYHWVRLELEEIEKIEALDPVPSAAERR
jgi:hypothetical protein